MSYTYPVEPARLTQGATAVELHQFLRAPNLISRRIQELTTNKFIADFLLPGRYVAQGGSVLFEEGGESMFALRPSEAIAPGAEFPLTGFDASRLAAAQTVKWGLDSEVTDEAITRRLDEPVNKSFRKLANTLIRDIDSIALAVIAARVQATEAATAPWTDDAKAIVRSVLRAKARREAALAATGLTYDFNTVVLEPEAHAIVVGEFMTSGQLRDAGSDAIATGDAPRIMGLDWVTSTHVPFSDPFIVDRNELGGMADERIESPGYTRTDDGVGIETKAIRRDETEKYLLRARRVTVPVVTDPFAGFRITGTGL